VTLALFPEEARVVIPDRVLYFPRLVAPEHSARLLAEVCASSSWRQEKLRVGGKSVDFPRLVSWHGDPGVSYSYSRITHPPAAWTPPLLEVRALVVARLGLAVVPNGVLLNRYRDGADSIGKHSDAEVDLVPGAPIVGVSLGAPRTMYFRPHKGVSGTGCRLVLEDGSMLVMTNDCQKTWTHEIGKEPGTSERVSLTFRTVRNHV
jgi:alkylated DNA repair dioxygenase AlkB